MAEDREYTDEELNALRWGSLSIRVERLANTFSSIACFMHHNPMLAESFDKDYPFAEDLERLVVKVNQWALATENKSIDAKLESERHAVG